MGRVGGGVRCIRCFGGKHVGKITLGGPRNRWKNNLNCVLKRYERGIDWNCLAQERDAPVASLTRSTASSSLRLSWEASSLFNLLSTFRNKRLHTSSCSDILFNISTICRRLLGFLETSSTEYQVTDRQTQ